MSLISVCLYLQTPPGQSNMSTHHKGAERGGALDRWRNELQKKDDAIQNKKPCSEFLHGFIKLVLGCLVAALVLIV